MLMSISAVSVSASNTDAISAVLSDSTSYTQLINQYNKLIPSSYNITAVAVHGENESDEKIGEDENCCLKFGLGTYGKETQSRFLLSKVALNANNPTDTPTSSAFYIGQQTAVTYWSVDVYDNGAITDITMQVGGAAMHTKVTSVELTDNAWNTFSAVYYPNTEDTTKCGYADFYLNGKFVETKDLSSISIVSEGNLSPMQTRFGFYFTDENATAYFDNIKIYEMTSFTRPTIDTSNVTVTDGVITDYVTETRRSEVETKEGSNTTRGIYTFSKYDATVKAVETLLGGAEIKNADGTDADDNAIVNTGMKVTVSPTVIEGVGTFVDNTVYTFSNIAESYIDATGLKDWGNGWNRFMGGISGMTTANEISSNNGTAKDPLDNSNIVAGYKLSGTVGTTVSHIRMSECYWDTATHTSCVPITIDAATTPIYASVDVYDNDVITDIQWETGGGADIGTDVITSDELNANAWNTFAVVYYPNLEDTSKLGSADAYLNGKFIGSSDLSGRDSWAYGGELRLSFKYTAANETAYFDNHKCYALTEFVRPDITNGSVTITDGAITGYTTETVAELEAATGAEIVTAEGVAADAAAVPVAGMKATASSTVAGVGTFTNEYVLGAGGYEIADWSYTAAENKLNAELPVVNLTGGDVTFTVLVAEYFGERFVNATVVPVTISAVNDSAKIENLTLTAGYNYKLLAWESLTNLRPIKNVIEFTN